MSSQYVNSVLGRSPRAIFVDSQKKTNMSIASPSKGYTVSDAATRVTAANNAYPLPSDLDPLYPDNFYSLSSDEQQAMLDSVTASLPKLPILQPSIDTTRAIWLTTSTENAQTTIEEQQAAAIDAVSTKWINATSYLYLGSGQANQVTV